MSLANQPVPPSFEFVSEVRIQSKQTMVDDLAFFGRKVGPRRRMGNVKARTHKEKENFCLRRLLLAWVENGKIETPVTIRTPAEGQKLPDFVLYWDTSRAPLGIEVTEAGDADWQKWLSKTEVGQPGDADLLPSPDGHNPEGDRKLLSSEIYQAITSKIGRLRKRSYSNVAQCDLLIYANSEGGGVADASDWSNVLDRLRSRQKEIENGDAMFRQTHLIFSDFVCFDLFGPVKPVPCDVSNLYGDDWSKWLQSQADHLRNRSFNRLDADNLANELESMAQADHARLKHSIRELLKNLLRWSLRDYERNADLKELIESYRDDIEEVLSENPALEERLLLLLNEQYKKVRQKLAKSEWAKKYDVSETEMPLDSPFRVDDLRDPGFFPGE